MTAGIFRTFPFPYKAMLSICSDLDRTPDRTTYYEIARFLNTEEQTAAGRGVGLEFGNTIYFDMPTDQFAYWNTDDKGRSMVRALIRSGHIDCFHSFGDLALDRDHARRALEELDKHDCRIQCWVDHAAAPTNFGGDIMRGSGDVHGSRAYHADLSFEHGVRFVWRGRVTSVIGQNSSPSLGGLVSASEPLASIRTAGIEAAKYILARSGNEKYAMHAANRLLRSVKLRDGHRVFEFIRCNPHWAGVSEGATADGLADILTTRFLGRLMNRGGVSVLYTHLGKTNCSGAFFGPETVAALRLLSDASKRGDVLVTTTSRLLRYCASLERLSVKVERHSSGETVHLDTSGVVEQDLPVELSGITVHVRDPRTARLVVDGREYCEIQTNPADESGQQSISIPWRPLSFPTL